MKQQINTYTAAIIAAIKAAHKAQQEPAKVEILPLMPIRSSYYKPTATATR